MMIFIHRIKTVIVLISCLIIVACSQNELVLTAVLPSTTNTPPSPIETLPPPLTSTPTSPPTDTTTPTQANTPTATFIPPEIRFPVSPSKLGDTLIRPADGMKMVFVPGGSFQMGSLPDDDYWDPHTVILDGFWIDQTEVTNAQFAAFLNDQGNQFEEGITWLEIEQMENAQIEIKNGTFQPETGKADHPVVEISWYGADAYCQWVGGRLPTEAEWEYAARGPENRVFPWGNDPPTCKLSQFSGCGDYSVPVGSLSDDGASWVGAKDMAGNVWEWVADWYGEYPTEPQTNPTGPESGDNQVARGGSFMSTPETLHTAYRFSRGGNQPALGFRCAASAPTPTSKFSSFVTFEPSSCRFEYNTPVDSECGDLIVPENRKLPVSPPIRIHVAVFGSTNPDHKPDPVIYVAGGGGVDQLNCTDYYVNQIGKTILQERDFIMYNQRGSHRNDPSLVCPDLTALYWKLASEA